MFAICTLASQQQVTERRRFQVRRRPSLGYDVVSLTINAAIS